jgi:uncharacterized membrane protein
LKLGVFEILRSSPVGVGVGMVVLPMLLLVLMILLAGISTNGVRLLRQFVVASVAYPDFLSDAVV